MIYWRFEHVILDMGKIHIYVKRGFTSATSRSLATLLPEGHIKNRLLLDVFALSFGISRSIDGILNLLLDTEEVALKMLST